MKPNTSLIKPATDPIKRIREANELKAGKAVDQRRHDERRMDAVNTQDAILSSFRSLVDYLEKRTSKTEVVNQLESIGTPDALEVAKAVREMHDTLKTHENTDLSEIASLLKSQLSELKQVPKDKVTIDIPKSVTVDNQTDYSKDFKSLLEAVKAIKLTAEAPKVEVKPADVHVEKTDLKPLVQAVEKSAKDNKLPDVVQTKQINTLVTETYDEYRMNYDTFDDDPDAPPTSITYFNKGKKVAVVSYDRDDAGRLTSVKKVAVTDKLTKKEK
jgi:hypothetical protein